MAVPWTVLSQTQAIRDVVNENLLAAAFFRPLQPNLIFREILCGQGDQWIGNADSMKFTRDGLLAKRGRRRQPGLDPTPQILSREQWTAVLASFNDTIDCFMPDTILSVINEWLSRLAALGSQSGRTMDSVVRDLAYAAGMAGNSYATALGVASVAFPVQCCYGFHEAVATGESSLSDVSAANTLAVTIGTSTTASVVACTPTNSGPEGIYGPGVLTLAVAKSWSEYDRIISGSRSPIYRSGGGTSMHNITQNDGLLVSTIRQVVAHMRNNSVPAALPNGDYAMFCSPNSIASLLSDPDWKQQHGGLGDSDDAFAGMAVGRVAGCTVYETSTCPGQESIDGGGSFSIDDPFPGGSGMAEKSGSVRIERPIICGADGIVEHRLQSTPVSEAGLPGTLKAMSSITADGIQINVNGIDLLLRPPMDRLGEVAAMTWKCKAGYGIPTDRLTGANAGTSTAERYKRFRIFEHGYPG